MGVPPCVLRQDLFFCFLFAAVVVICFHFQTIYHQVSNSIKPARQASDLPGSKSEQTHSSCWILPVQFTRNTRPSPINPPLALSCSLLLWNMLAA